MAEKEYRRLTRSRSRTIFGIVSHGRSSLWLGKDHILSVEANGYTETYKRFYFRDIQALILRKTATWLVWGTVLGSIAALFALIAVLGGDVVVAWIFGILGGFFGLALAFYLAAGPTCAAQLRTAVQTEEVPSLCRLRRARKVLARLRPLLAEAQGQLAPEEIPARMEEWRASASGLSPSPAAAPRFVVDDPNAPPRIIS